MKRDTTNWLLTMTGVAFPMVGYYLDRSFISHTNFYLGIWFGGMFLLVLRILNTQSK